MGNFNRDFRSGGPRDFHKRDFGGRGTDRQMFKTICSKCGRECEVPFRPSGEKPVYCSNCFDRNGRSTDSSRFGDRNSPRPHFDSRNSNPPQNNEQFNRLNAKLDKILALLTSGSSVKETLSPLPESTRVEKTPEEVLITARDLPLPSVEPAVIPQKKKRVSKKA